MKGQKGISQFPFINYSFCLFHTARKFPYLYAHNVHSYAYKVLESFSESFFGFCFLCGVFCIFDLDPENHAVPSVLTGKQDLVFAAYARNPVDKVFDLTRVDIYSLELYAVVRPAKDPVNSRKRTTTFTEPRNYPGQVSCPVADEGSPFLVRVVITSSPSVPSGSCSPVIGSIISKSRWSDQ